MSKDAHDLVNEEKLRKAGVELSSSETSTLDFLKMVRSITVLTILHHGYQYDYDLFSDVKKRLLGKGIQKSALHAKKI